MRCVSYILLPILLVVQFQIVHSQDGFATLGQGTTGGAGGSTVTVCSEDELFAALTDDVPRIVRIICNISLTRYLSVGSNKSILGGSRDAGITERGFHIVSKHNVIIRGLLFSNPVDEDCIEIRNNSTNIWIDHNDFQSDRDHEKDYYDGLVDIIRGSDYITFSWNRFYNHWKTNLIGHSDENGAEDIGKLRVTFHHNYYLNVNSRVPSIRFGTAHIYNNVYEDITTSGINSRMGAEVLVEGNVFRNTKRPLTTSLDSREDGFAVVRNNDWGGQEYLITRNGSFTNPPYLYRVDPLRKLYFVVQRNAGSTMQF